MDRDDLAFATVHQLAGLIESDWDRDTRKEESSQALHLLSMVDEPDSEDGRTLSVAALKLGITVFKCSVPETLEQVLSLLKTVPPNSPYGKSLRIATLNICVQAFKLVLVHSDGWKSDEADMIKKEVASRIRQYERRASDLTKPCIDLGHIEFRL
jgi:hypothetical protein